MVQFKTREEMINGIVQLLIARPTAEVILVVGSHEAGIEIVQGNPTVISAFGLLDAAHILLDERMRETMKSPQCKEADAKNAAEVAGLMTSSNDGKVN